MKQTKNSLNVTRIGLLLGVGFSCLSLTSEAQTLHGVAVDHSYLVDAHVIAVDDSSGRKLAQTRTGDYGKFTIGIPDTISELRLIVSGGREDSDGKLSTTYDAVPQQGYVTRYCRSDDNDSLTVSYVTTALWQYRKQNPDDYPRALTALPSRLRRVIRNGRKARDVERAHRILDTWLGARMIVEELSDNGRLDGSRYRTVRKTLVNRLLARTRGFPDRNLDLCIRANLEIKGLHPSLTRPLTPAMLDEITSLSCPGHGIRTLEGIQRLKHLNDLILPDNLLSRTPQLKRLRSLRYLDLTRNYLKRVQRPHGLKILAVGENCIDDPSRLESETMSLFGKKNQRRCRSRQNVHLFDFTGVYEEGEPMSISWRAVDPSGYCILHFGDGRHRRVPADGISHETDHRYDTLKDAENALLICSRIRKRIALTEKEKPHRSTRVKKTGQQVSYDEEGQAVTDGSLKDDGYYQSGVAEYYRRDDATQIVTDEVTGLQWQDDEAVESVKKPWLDTENAAKCFDDESEAACRDTSGDTAESYCKTLRLGGYADWRLPTVNELLSITSRVRYNPAFNTDLFRHTRIGDHYWSTTENAKSPKEAWTMYAAYGINGIARKDAVFYLRCVRTAESNTSIPSKGVFR